MQSKARRASRPAAPPDRAAAAAVEKAAAPPAAAVAAKRTEDLAGLARETCEAFAQSQQTLARGCEAFGLEVLGLAHSGIDRAAKAASEMLAVRTLSDAVEVNAELVRNGFDSLLEGSTRLSELGLRYAREAARPLLRQWERDWARAFDPEV